MPTQSLSPDSFQTFGDLLKYLRRRERLTQLELSIAVGYSDAQITRLEKNQRRPDVAALKALFIPALHMEHESQLVVRFLELAESAQLEDTPATGVPPYKGLLFFDQADAELFFGRETLVAHLTNRITGLAADAASRFLAVVGASGSGKSSLVRAGLAVTLHGAGWEIHTFTPTTNPLKTLAVCYSSTHSQNSRQHLILVDQFEETFTLCHDENERAAFIERLLAIAHEKSTNTTVVIALRADFYSHCSQYPLLREAVAAEQEYIGQMTNTELRRAIEEPAKRSGWEFESGLVDVLLNDIGADGTGQPEPGALPLLSHALLATWERRRGRTFTLDGYRASGGVRGAIAETAESVFTDQLNHKQQELARDAFLRLTELGEGTEDTRRRAALNELTHQSEEAAQLRMVLNTLADARLITLNEDSAEVAHEALIREWQRLRDWLTQDREGLRLHRHLTDAAHEWEARGHDVAELYRGARLSQIIEWASTNEERLNTEERKFIAASIEREQHEALEREAQRQRELEAAQKLAETQSRAAKQLRKRAIFLTGAFVLAMVFAGVALFFGNQASLSATTAQKNAAVAQQNAAAADANAKQAEAEQRIATSRELAGASLINLNIDPERSILLALQAETKADTFQAQEALHRAIQTSRLLKRASAPVGECYCSIAFSPDGTRLVTESRDANGQLTTQIRDAVSLAVLFTKPGVWADDRWLDANYLPIAAPSADHSKTILTVWDVSGQRVIAMVTLDIYFDDKAPFLDVSPDQTKVAAVSSTDLGNLSVYDIATGQMSPRLGKPGYAYNGMLRFSPDSRSLLTNGAPTDDAQEMTLWDVSTGRELWSLPLRTPPSKIDFSPDGKRFAIDDGQKIRIVDIASGGDAATLTGHTGFVESGLQFNKDGTRLASVASDGTTRIWNTATGQSLLTIFGNDVSIRTAAISPDNTRLATLSAEGVQTWAIAATDTHEWLTVSTTTNCNNCMIALSPDGLQMAIFNDDDTVKLVDSKTGYTRFTFPLVNLGEQGRGLSFRPDGKQLAIASGDNIVHVWDLITGKESLILVDTTGPVERVIFSPDGEQLAAIDRNGKAWLWDAKTGQKLFSLQAYDGSILQLGNVVGIAFNSNGSRLATAGGIDIKIWDTSTGQTVLALPPIKGLLAYTVTFSPDGKHLAVGFRGGSANVWDAVTGKKLFDLSGHTGSVRDIVYSPDGKRIATASVDGTTRVWDAATGFEQFALTGHTGIVTSLAFSADSTRLATGGRDGTVQIYALRLEDLIKIAQSHLTRSLTTEECQKYLHMDACPIAP